MEAIKALAPPPPDTAPGNHQRASDHLRPIPSPDEEGFFYPAYKLPDYDSTVDAASVRQLKKPLRHRDYGVTHLESWTMNDEAGTEYHVARCLADDPVSDVWVVKDTAWSTQPAGANIDVARKLMKLGFNVLIKGPEIGSSLPLSESAYNTHQLLNTLEDRGDMEASQIAVEGYSRGSMIGFGTNAYAERFDRQVLYSNLTDPCVAIPIKILDAETAKKGLTLPADIALLGIAVAKGLMDVRRSRHLIKTVDLSPAGAKQFVRTGGPLMTGEAGMMADRTPKDMQATVAFFRRCRVNDWQVYQRILADRPSVRFVRPEGGHGGGLDQRIIGNIAVRFGRLAEQLRDGRTASELDYDNIIYG